MSYSFPSREKVGILICVYAYAASFQGVCAHAFAYVRMCVRVPVHMCARAYVCVYATHVSTHVSMYTYVCTYVRACAHMFVRRCSFAHVHMYV